MILIPTYYKKRVYQITPKELIEQGIEGLILDVDNTLTTHDNPVPNQRISKWLKEIENSNIKMIILSNNKDARVKPFAKILGLQYIARGNKPLTGGLKKCSKKMGLNKHQVAMVGDQLFTDVWAGNRFGCITYLVEPIQTEGSIFFTVKRKLEKLILKNKKSKK